MIKILNFRTLAKNIKNTEGKKIKPNTIFRSGAVGRATKIDILRLKTYGVCDIYDFRSRHEKSTISTLSHMGFTTHHFDILEEAANTDVKSYLKMSRDELNTKVIKLYSDEFGNTEGYKGAIQDILKQKSPEFLFHCTAGKDRTGIFGAMLMMILDFDIADIKKEYLNIDKRSMKILGSYLLKKAGISPNDVDITKFDGIMGVLPEFIDAYFETVFKNHDEIELYLKEKVGVTPEIKSEFKMRYLVK